MNMLISWENKVGKIREKYQNSLYIKSVLAVLLKKKSKITPTHSSDGILIGVHSTMHLIHHIKPVHNSSVFNTLCMP